MLGEEQIRDVVLSRFVPGYAYGLPSKSRFPNIHIDFAELEALSK